MHYRYLCLSSTLILLACPGTPPPSTDGGSSTTGTPTTTTGDLDTTRGSTSSTDPTTSGSTTTGGSTSDSTDSTGIDDTTGSGSSSDGASTGMAAFDVPFAVLDPSVLSLTARVQPGWMLVTSLAQWQALTNAPVPMGVDFSLQSLVYGSHGPQPFPGHAIDAATLTWDGGIITVQGDAVEPDNDCETYQFTWPADTLLVIDVLDVGVDSIDDQTMPLPTSCAMGAGQSMNCNLSTPCATGLLCAGLIRSTVLAGNPGGLCLPSTNAGVFTGGAVVIPSNGSMVETSQVVGGLTTVDMDVVIWVELDHPAPQELVIELRNPSGNQVSVANLQSSPLHPGGVGIVPTGFSGDESVNGTWFLVVTDAVVNGNNGGVLSWELEIMSRLD